jgi:hypothetical protein
MAQLVGTRTTYQTRDTESRLIRAVDDQIAYLEPNEGGLITLLNSVQANRKATINPKFEWLEKDYVARWGTIDGSSYNDSVTTVNVTDGTQFSAGDLVLVPKAVTDSTAPEVFRVTAVSTNALTVVRGVGGNAASIDANAPVRILGSAAEENGSKPTPKTAYASTPYNYTQIFRTGLSLSGTQMASAAYGGVSEWDGSLREKLVEHKIKLNSQFLFGKASESMTGGPGGYPIRTTKGINSFIATNVFNAGGTLGRKGLEEFARMSFRYGKSEKVLIACPMIVSAITAWANSQLQVTMSESSFGMRVQKIRTGHGDWILVRDWMLENPSGSTAGFGGWAFSIDLDNVLYRYLEANGVNRDTKLIELSMENQAGVDGKYAEYISEVGLQAKLEQTHSKMYNVTGYFD